MMKQNLILIAALLTFASCSSAPKRNTVSLTPASSGILKNHDIAFPLYLTDKIENRSEVESKTASNVFIIHTGHILKADATKEQNIATLESLSGKGIDVVNLTLEDFTIADAQGIALESYPQQFLNSSVVDLNEDNFVKKPNISPYIIHEDVALIGLSDKKMDKKFKMDKFLVSDYVLAVLRARKSALKDPAVDPSTAVLLRSFVIVHTIGSDINDVMERLPSNFINSLAD